MRTKFSRKLSPGPQCRRECETSLMYRTAEKLHLPMHLVNVKIKNYLKGKCFITDIAVIKGSIGRGFWQGIIRVSPLYLSEAEESLYFKNDLKFHRVPLHTQFPSFQTSIRHLVRACFVLISTFTGITSLLAIFLILTLY